LLAIAEGVVDPGDTTKVKGEVASSTDYAPVVIVRHQDLPLGDGPSRYLEGTSGCVDGDDTLLAKASNHRGQGKPYGCSSGGICKHVGETTAIQGNNLWLDGSMLASLSTMGRVATASESDRLSTTAHGRDSYLYNTIYPEGRVCRNRSPVKGCMASGIPPVMGK